MKYRCIKKKKSFRNEKETEKKGKIFHYVCALSKKQNIWIIKIVLYALLRQVSWFYYKFSNI